MTVNPFTPSYNPGTAVHQLSPAQAAKAWQEIVDRTSRGMTVSKSQVADISARLSSSAGPAPVVVTASAAPAEVAARRAWLAQQFGIQTP